MLVVLFEYLEHFCLRQICTYSVYTVFPQIETQAFISFTTFLTRSLNKARVYSDFPLYTVNYLYLKTIVIKLMSVHMAASLGVCSVFEKASVIRGHHTYKKYWMPAAERELMLVTKDGYKHE